MMSHDLFFFCLSVNDLRLRSKTLSKVQEPTEGSGASRKPTSHVSLSEIVSKADCNKIQLSFFKSSKCKSFLIARSQKTAAL